MPLGSCRTPIHLPFYLYLLFASLQMGAYWAGGGQLLSVRAVDILEWLLANIAG
jgi:hypothetical protein